MPAQRPDLDVPAATVAGDSFTAVASHPGYPAGAGGSATLVLIGAGTRHTVAGVAQGDSFVFGAPAADTAGWAPGAYTTAFAFAHGPDRASAVGPIVKIAPDPLASDTLGAALLTGWRRILADLEAAYQAHIASGLAQVAEYTIAGRTTKFLGVADLLKQLHNARSEVAREAALDRAAQGLAPLGRFVTRM